MARLNSPSNRTNAPPPLESYPAGPTSASTGASPTTGPYGTMRPDTSGQRPLNCCGVYAHWSGHAVHGRGRR